MKKKVKKSRFLTKQHIVEKKILPYFKGRKLKEITAADVIECQNEMISFKNGKEKVIYRIIFVLFMHS